MQKLVNIIFGIKVTFQPRQEQSKELMVVARHTENC